MTDFCQEPAYLPSLLIKREKVERVSQHKYQETVLDSKLSFDQNTALIQKKCQSKIHLLQKTSFPFFGLVWKSEWEEQKRAFKGCDCKQQDFGWGTGKLE